jgi:GTP-binding protein
LRLVLKSLVKVQKKLRNVAIIAHVDHGKTTLVDEMLQQSGVFGAHQEIVERVMDSNDLEKERGITILSKNASISYQGHRINIVDTPGHADFGGQVERVLGTVDGVLLVVDAWEGPMAQTRFVTQKALSMGLTPIVVINKIDRDGCDPHKALDGVFDLFCDLGASEKQLEFAHIFTSARAGTCRLEMDQEDQNFQPLFQMIIDKIPAYDPQADQPPLLQISTLEYSEFLGQLAVGRVKRGTLKTGMTLSQSRPDGKIKKVRVQKLLGYEGIRLSEKEAIAGGDIALISGLGDFDIGDTLSPSDKPEVLERIYIDPPTIAMNFGVNTSPLTGKYGGKFLTGKHLEERLSRAALADPALHVEKSDEGGSFRVSGRGVMHLTILIENMRREGYELAVGAPQVLFKRDEEGRKLEPFEIFKVEVPAEFSGAIIEELAGRKGEMLHMEQVDGQVFLEYAISSRALIGVRTRLMSMSKGYAVTQSLFRGYEPFQGEIPTRKTGVLIAKDAGDVTAYALWKLDNRGTFFVPPGREVYPGMIIGENSRSEDITVNITKGKQLTNMRASGSDDNIILPPHRELSLEESVTFIKPDEKVEITPQLLRICKAELDEHKRKKDARQFQTA